MERNRGEAGRSAALYIEATVLGALMLAALVGGIMAIF